MTKPEQNRDVKERIRHRFDYARREWSPIFKEGGIDVRFVAGDPWDCRDVAAREKVGNKRPHMVFDEASQYVNGYCGQARQQRRTGKVEPSSGADLKTCEILQQRLYEIDYSSRSSSHKMKALKDAVTRSYGWLGVGRRYSGSRGREQEPYIRGFANPDSVLMDPDCKEYDCSDAMYCFVQEKWPKDRIKAKYRDARDLGGDGETLLLMIYWEVELETVDRMLSFAQDEQPDVLESELPEGFDMKSSPLIDERDIVSKKVKKYVVQMRDNFGGDGILDTVKRFFVSDDAESNVEILEVEDWDDNKNGEEDPNLVCIPVVGVFGEEYWVSSDGGDNPSEAKRTLLSMVRRARGPMQALNLTVSTQAELSAMIPKTRYLGYEGQFAGHEQEFETVGSSPLAYLQVVPMVDPVGKAVLPLPRKENWEPPIHNLEIFAQSLRNAIRAAVGQIASPELDKAKSGIAMKRLEDSGAAASFSFTDNFDMSLEQLYRLLLRQIIKTHDTDREIGVRNDLGEKRLVRINAPWTDEKGQNQYYDFQKGAYSCTVSTGPSYQSQFEATSEFIDTLAASNPEIMMLFGDILTAMKNLGPDAKPLIERFKKIAEKTLPGITEEASSGEVSPAVVAQLQQMLEQATAKLTELTEERDLKLLEIQSKDEINQRDNETRKEIALVNASTKENTVQLIETLKMIQVFLSGQAAMQSADQQHAQQMERQNVAHEQGLESGDIAHAQSMESQEAQQAAAAESQAVEMDAAREMAAQQDSEANASA